MSPLLELSEARVDVDGTPLFDGLSASADGALVGLLGDWSPLHLLLQGRAQLSAGRVTITGHDAADAVSSGIVGVVPREPLLPDDFTAATYLVEGGRLGGMSKRDAKDAALGTLRTLDLAHLSARRIGTLTPAERRALVLALALLDAPPVLVVEDPGAGLDERGEQLLLVLVERAAAGRSLVVSAVSIGDTGPVRALFARADSVVTLSAGTVVAQGKLEDTFGREDSILVTVTDQGRALAEALGARGFAVSAARESGVFAPLDPELLASLGGALRLVVRLPAGQTSAAILDAALGVRAPIVELRPIAGPRAP